MQVYKTFFKIAYKKLPSLFIYFGIFAFLTFVLSSSGSDSKSSFTETKLKLCVIDNDESETSKALVKFMANQHRLIELENDKEVLQDALFNRDVDYILMIPENFQDVILQGSSETILENVKIPGSTSGLFADRQISRFMSILNSYIHAGYELEEGIAKTMSDAAVDTKVKLIETQGDAANSNFYYFSQYLPYIFICLLLTGLGPIIMTFHGKELRDRTTCSSMSLMKKNVQLGLGSVSFMLLVWGIFMLLAVIAYGGEVFTIQGLLYAGNSFVFVLIAMSMTYLLSYFATNMSVLNMMANVMGLGLSFLGGVFVPLEFLSDSVITVSRFLPTYWYVKAVDLLNAYTGTTAQINSYLSYIGIQMGFAVAIFAGALVVSKMKVSKNLT